MKEEWIKRYEDAVESIDFNSTVLTGFNTNIDCTIKFGEMDMDLEGIEAEKKDALKSEEDLKKMLKYCKENSSNHEVSINNFNPDLEGKEQLGGQGAIMANFLSGLGNRSIFYTPFLSERIADLLNKEVVYPVIDDTLQLKNAEEGVNSDRTKKNYIIEFEEESCRLILSDSIRGFGPYFRKSVEEKLEAMDGSVDRVLLSGFHDAEGNVESKIRKSRQQLEKIDVPKHVEFVSSGDERDRMMLEEVVPEFTSIGMDEQEMRNIAEILDVEIHEETSLGDAYHVATKLMEKTGISRVQIHTLKFHTAVARDSYPVEPEKMRQAVLFGGLSAVSMAEKGEIPEKEEIGFNEEGMHINRVDDLEHFEDFFNLDNFSETGIAHLEDYKIVAAPTIIHEDPKRLVGLGDLISSGTFTAEIS